MISVWKSKN